MRFSIARRHSDPLAQVTDEYDVVHTLYPIQDPQVISDLILLMDGKKLVIADGHHRYETALAFRNDHPELEDAQWVMMTFVNMHSPGLRILATHRVLTGLTDFDFAQFIEKAKTQFEVSKLDTVGALDADL